MLLSQMPNLYIVNHPEKGRCVHCAEDIPLGAVIEICPLIILAEKDSKLIHQTRLHDYYFIWDEALNTTALALGYGSLYNHSSTANAELESLMDTNEIRFTALRNIPAGEEITINYQGAGKDGEVEIWFEEV